VINQHGTVSAFFKNRGRITRHKTASDASGAQRIGILHKRCAGSLEQAFPANPDQPGRSWNVICGNSSSLAY
jgi:hypothetical protein